MQHQTTRQSKFVWKGLYKGALPAFYSSIYLNAAQFPLLSYFDGDEEGRPMSGFLTGVIVSPFLFELDRKYHYRRQRQYREQLLAGADDCSGVCRYGHVLEFLCISRRKNHHPLVAGGTAGVLSWVASYNLDVLKTRTIAGEPFRKAFKRGQLWKGLPIALIRAFVVNAFVFYAYEIGKQAVN